MRVFKSFVILGFATFGQALQFAENDQRNNEGRLQFFHGIPNGLNRCKFEKEIGLKWSSTAVWVGLQVGWPMGLDGKWAGAATLGS